MKLKIMQKLKIPEIKKIILVASGKGGVGKSSIASNLAVMLAQNNFKIGLLDADIYGPSVAFMLGMRDKILMNASGKFIPHQKYGIKFISMDSFIGPEGAAMWRGPMVTKMLYNFLVKTDWGALDYLILDSPPGTGDIYISLATNFLIDCSILVTTSQKIAMLDVKKVFYMLKKLEIPILGIVENMSYKLIKKIPTNAFINSSKDNNNVATNNANNKEKEANNINGTEGENPLSNPNFNNEAEEYLFGSLNNTIGLIKDLNTELIARVPFRRQISESADNGVPAVLDLEIAAFYAKIMETLIKT